MKYHLIYILLLLPGFLYSQTLIQGVVRDLQHDKGIEGVNVMMQESGSSAIYAYVITDKDGKYKLEYKGSKDSLTVFISGFNIKKQTKEIASKNQTLDFNVAFESISLKEVKITPPKIRQTGDTINYLVDGFLDKNDRTIGDVLKKMPGIDVKESGQVLYQNKPINKFYIENMDLLQGRYGVATNNIDAKNVSSVQVLENHQPVKALKDKVYSDDAAINLKLKDSAKGTITANALLGVGVSPFLWSGEVTGMYFAKNYQNITSYKGNNIGNDVSRDLKSFYSREADKMGKSDFLRLQSPSSPSITEKRYMFNNANAVTLNNLWKLKDDYQLNVNLNYLNDREDKSSYARTEYYIPGEELLKVEERLSSRAYTNKADAEIQLNANKDKNYFNNLFKFEGNWNSERGEVGNSQDVSQKLSNPYYNLNNTFEFVKVYDKTTLNIYSFNAYSILPQSLTIQPLLYENLFDPDIDADGMHQELDLNRFVSYSKIASGYEKGKWKQNYELGFRADLEHLESELSPYWNSSPQTVPQIPDSLSNDLQWNKFEWSFTPSYTFVHNDFRIGLNLPLSYTLLKMKDNIENGKENIDRINIKPVLSLRYKLSPFWDLYGVATYTNSLGGIRNMYGGYIMDSYRNLKRNEGDLYETYSQLYQINLNYRHPIHALFGSLSVKYFNNKANLLYGYDYDGILQVQTALDYPNRTEGVSTNINMSKNLDFLSSTVRLGGSFSTSTSSQLSQGEIVRYRGNNYSLSPGFSMKFDSWSSLSYSLTYAESRNKVKNTNKDFDPIRSVSQRAQVNLFPFSGLTVNLIYEYFYNNAIASGSRTMSFGDIAVKYKWKKMEFLLDYTNIFNSKQYTSASYDNISSYYYSYDLRPSELMLKVRFKIK